MVTLAETTELSEMHDAVGKWTQLWPRLTHWRKNVSQGDTIVSQGDTATCLCHADNCQTATSNVQKIVGGQMFEKFCRLLKVYLDEMGQKEGFLKHTFGLCRDSNF